MLFGRVPSSLVERGCKSGAPSPHRRPSDQAYMLVRTLRVRTELDQCFPLTGPCRLLRHEKSCRPHRLSHCRFRQAKACDSTLQRQNQQKAHKSDSTTATTEAATPDERTCHHTTQTVSLSRISAAKSEEGFSCEASGQLLPWCQYSTRREPGRNEQFRRFAFHPLLHPTIMLRPHAFALFTPCAIIMPPLTSL